MTECSRQNWSDWGRSLYVVSGNLYDVNKCMALAGKESRRESLFIAAEHGHWRLFTKFVYHMDASDIVNAYSIAQANNQRYAIAWLKSYIHPPAHVVVPHPLKIGAEGQ